MNQTLINDDVIREVVRYFNNNFVSIKSRYDTEDSDALKSALVYQYLHLRYFGNKILIWDILGIHRKPYGATC